MKEQDIIAAVKDMVRKFDSVFVMGTVGRDSRPHVRYMAGVVMDEPFTLYMQTFYDTRKVDDLIANPHVSLLMAKPDWTQWVTIMGRAAMEINSQKKREIFDRIPISGAYFNGPDDPNYGVIVMAVDKLELWTGQRQREPFVARL
jgi:general stress protein 26